MKGLTKIDDKAIKFEVNKDIAGRNKPSLLRLQTFYYKIVTEDEVRTSSFRYRYAMKALVVVSESLEDTDTIDNLKSYHSSKVKFEIANPLKKDNEGTILKSNPATKEQRFGGAVKVDKNAGQIQI